MLCALLTIMLLLAGVALWFLLVRRMAAGGAQQQRACTITRGEVDALNTNLMEHDSSSIALQELAQDHHSTSRENQGDTLFTCTSFVTFPGRLQELRRALKTFLEHNTSKRIREYLVVNEYDEGADTLVDRLRSEFPRIRFMQKGLADKGQARSLNLILDHLRQHRYTYWIHWEESWYCTGRFIDDTLEILDTTRISQMSLEDNHWDWRGEGHGHLEYTYYPKYVHIQPKNRRDYRKRRHVPWEENIHWWPLFSLRPGVDRAAHVLRSGKFNTAAAKWPVIFEYDFAHKWLSKGGTIGTLRQGHTKRDQNRRSTY